MEAVRIMSGYLEIQPEPLFPDVLIPKMRMGQDETGHHLDALGVVQVDHLNAMRAKERRRIPARPLPTGKIHRLPDDHLRNPKLHDRPAAQKTRHQRRVKNRIAISLLPASAIV